MNESEKRCRICGEGNLDEKVGKHSVEYKGKVAELDLYFSLCRECGIEQSNSTQLRSNKRAMVAFKKQVDGLLVGTEVRQLRIALGITQVEAAQIFGGGPVAFSKYESDDVSQSEAMDKLLRLSADLPDAFSLLIRRAGLGSKYASARSWQVVTGLAYQSGKGSRSRPFKPRVVSKSSPMDEKQKRYAA